MNNQRLAVGLMIGQAILFAIKTAQLPMQLLRGLVSVLYLWVLMYSFAHIPFADATAIAYTQAAYIAVFSALILNERITALRWIATAIGTVGALLIVKPAFLDRNIVYLVAFLGTSFNGLAFVLNKYLQRPGGDSELTTMFYVNAIAVVCNLPVLATTALPKPDVWPWLSGVLIFGPVGMYLGLVAVRNASASSLGPYTLLRLVIAIIGGIVLFREIPDLLSWLGVAAILSSCLLALGPEASRAQPRVV